MYIHTGTDIYVDAHIQTQYTYEYTSVQTHFTLTHINTHMHSYTKIPCLLWQGNGHFISVFDTTIFLRIETSNIII